MCVALLSDVLLRLHHLISLLVMDADVQASHRYCYHVHIMHIFICLTIDIETGFNYVGAVVVQLLFICTAVWDNN